MINEEIIREKLRKVIDPESGKDIISLGIVSSIVIKGGHVGFALEFSHQKQIVKDLRIKCENTIKTIPESQK